MTFLTDGVGRFEKTLPKIRVVIRKKYLGQCLRGGLLNYCFLRELVLNALSFYKTYFSWLCLTW